MWKPIAVLLALTCCAALATEKTIITIDADSDDGVLYNFWSTTVTTAQRRFLTNSEHALIRREAPFAKYINCVRLVGGRNDGDHQFFKGIAPDGEAICDFTDAKKMLRGIIQAGFTPRIVLDNVPTEMSDTKQMNAYGNTLPAKDSNVWHSYVRQFVEMLVAEFGREEVVRWRFRVGTEPDLNPGHWSGTEQEYFKHYDYTVDAVTSVIPEAEIGPGNILNPAQAPAKPKKGWWGLNIIDHCATGMNYKTGAIGTRICFFGISWYGQVGKSVDTFDVAIGKIRERLARYPQLARTAAVSQTGRSGFAITERQNKSEALPSRRALRLVGDDTAAVQSPIPIEIHEFSVLKDEKRRMLYGGEATEWGASWMAAVAEKVYDHNVAQVFQWNVTSLGVPIPRTHVLSLLEKMENGQRLATRSPAPGEMGCLAGKKNGGVDLLVFRHETVRANEPAAETEIALSGKLFNGKKWRIAQANLIDLNHSNFMRAFLADAKAAGIKPSSNVAEFSTSPVWQFGEPGRELFERNRKKYETLARLAPLQPLPKLKQRSDGVTFSVSMLPQSVIYVRLEPR